jgi:hypothetical protein
MAVSRKLGQWQIWVYLSFITTVFIPLFDFTFLIENVLYWQSSGNKKTVHIRDGLIWHTILEERIFRSPCFAHHPVFTGSGTAASPRSVAEPFRVAPDAGYILIDFSSRIKPDICSQIVNIIGMWDKLNNMRFFFLSIMLSIMVFHPTLTVSSLSIQPWTLLILFAVSPLCCWFVIKFLSV